MLNNYLLKERELMKRKLFGIVPVYFFVIISLGFVKDVEAQTQALPSFEIILSSRKAFSQADIPKGKPVIIIYFDPECDHCQKLMDELFKKILQFKKAEIVMVTYKPLDELPPFEKKYAITKFPNIHVGTEGAVFFLRDYYGLTKMPFVALYNKKGTLVYSNREQPSVEEISGKLNNLK